MFNVDMDKVKEKAKAFKEIASEAVVKTVNAAGRAAAVTKVKFKITSKEMDIKNEYKEIGKIIYTAYKEDKEVDNEKIAEKCVTIDKYNEEIETLRASVANESDSDTENADEEVFAEISEETDTSEDKTEE